jgi:Fe-S-cluster containining protein
VLWLGVPKRPDLMREMKNGRPSFAGSDDPARTELLALYAETDALLAPYSCDASGECCNFANTGREPYPTPVELAEVELAMAQLGGAPARSAPNRHALPLANEDRTCALLSDGRCTIYESRPFGCRTFFCHRVQGPSKLPRADLQRIARDIAALAARFSPRDPLPRPLSRVISPRSKWRRGPK